MPGVNYDKAWPNVMRFIDLWRQTHPYKRTISTPKFDQNASIS